jgi:hypothetical protein
MHDSGEHPALRFNTNTRVSTAALFWDIEEGFNATPQSGLPYTFSELESSSRFIEVVAPLLSIALHLFLGPWSLFQFLDLLHRR